MIKLTLLLAMGFLSIASRTSSAATTEQPNVLIIFVDDFGPGDVSCFGGSHIQTPAIDQLASEGLKFDQFYVASPICSPSRCGLITGQFPARWKITSYLQSKAGNHECEQADFLDSNAPSVVRAFHDAGYATAHVGKWHLGGGRDVTDAPKFAAYGYDPGLGTYESPEPAAGLGLKSVPWDTTILTAVDIFPTLCALTGVAPPAEVKFDGEDLSSAFTGQQQQRCRLIFWEYGRKPAPTDQKGLRAFPYPNEPHSESPNVAVRDGDWKLLVNADGSSVELYNLQDDRVESKNIAADHPQVTDRLKNAALQWHQSLP